jgi:hypothetical protein|tara:strand:- start:430 stop:726 length:297 start_codon:yes stop_codon:yes gene_type:complete
MSLKKDKEKVLGEVFDDERVRSFLEWIPPSGVSTDFHLLEKAYRGMNIDNFATFLSFFKEAGHDLNAANPDGKTLVEVAGEHGHGLEYVAAIRAAAAQ